MIGVKCVEKKRKQQIGRICNHRSSLWAEGTKRAGGQLTIIPCQTAALFGNWQTLIPTADVGEK